MVAVGGSSMGSVLRTQRATLTLPKDGEHMPPIHTYQRLSSLLLNKSENLAPNQQLAPSGKGRAGLPACTESHAHHILPLEYL